MYYPLALHLAPTPSQPLVNPSPAPPSSSDQLTLTPFAALTKDKELEQPPPANVVDVETKEIVEVVQLKRKKKEKEQEKKGRNGKETSA